MSERVLALIWIGGRLEESRAGVLIDAINGARLYAHEGDQWFEPRSAADLRAARTPEGLLQLCDDEAPGGEMPGVENACHELGLSYRLWHESLADGGAVVTYWSPGMDRHMVLSGHGHDPETFLVDGPPVASALVLLEQGRVRQALGRLRSTLPRVPALPAMEIVPDQPRAQPPQAQQPGA